MAMVPPHREGPSVQTTNQAEERLEEGAAMGPCQAYEPGHTTGLGETHTFHSKIPQLLSEPDRPSIHIVRGDFRSQTTSSQTLLLL